LASDSLDGALAALPFVLVLFLMVGRRWSAGRAAGVGLVAAFVLAWVWFIDPGFGERWRLAVGAMAEALFTAGTIAWIVFAALCIHQLQVRGGSLERIQGALTKLSPDPRLRAVLVAWFFALFLEGAAGFGTPVALAAPLLVAFGFRAIDAVALALLGHAVGVSFGAVGTPVIAQATLTGVAAEEIAGETGLYHAVLGAVMLVFFVRLAMQAAPQPEGEAGRSYGLWGWAAFAGIAFLAPYFALARWVGPELPTLGGAVMGSGVFVGALLLTSRWRSGQRFVVAEQAPGDGRREPAIPLYQAAAPYVVLVALIASTRMIPPLRDALQEYSPEWTLFGEFSGSIQPFYHPGTMLFASFVVGGLLQRASWPRLMEAFLAAGRQVAPAAIALVATLGMARVMVHGGMTAALAVMAAASAGGVWPLVAPFVGVLGAFTTGSATASNVLFSDFQEDTARRLDLSTTQTLGAQGFGAAVGNVVSPHNIVAGSATVGLKGREGEVLRKTAVPCLAYTAAGGLFALVRARLGG
jgi:lactate permease